MAQTRVVDFVKERDIQEITQILETMPSERVSLIRQVLQAQPEAQDKLDGFQACPIITYTGVVQAAL